MKAFFLGLVLTSSSLGSYAKAASDAVISHDISSAIVGVMSGGGEGDSVQYKLVEAELASDVALTDAFLIEKILPQLDGMEHESSGMIPGVEKSSQIKDEWKGLTEAPVRSEYETEDEYLDAVTQSQLWAKVKVLFDSNLIDVRAVNMGYRSSPTGSLETGAVGRVILGRTGTGRVIAIYGIDIWT